MRLVADNFKEITEFGAPKPARTSDVVVSQCGVCPARNGCGMIDLLREIPAPDRRQLFVPHRIAKGDYLFCAGDQLNAVYVVKSGVIKHYFEDVSGSELVTGFTRSGQVLGIEALLHGTAGTAAVALEAVTVCALSVAVLENVPDTVWSAWLMTKVCNERKRERMLRLVLGRHASAESRVAYFLLEQAAAHNECGYPSRILNLGIPPQDVASYLDLSLEAVSQAWSNLQEAGIVLLEWPYVTIIEPENLLPLALPDTFTAATRARPNAHPAWTSAPHSESALSRW